MPSLGWAQELEQMSMQDLEPPFSVLTREILLLVFYLLEFIFLKVQLLNKIKYKT